jgi:hypothetical protein
MTLHAWFANDSVEVAPGTALRLLLCIQNKEADVESVAIVPAGPASTWISLPSEEVLIPAGQTVEIPLELTPPELPTTNAGPTTVAVRVIPRDERVDLPVETTIDVLPFDDRRIVALQPVQRTRRRATYEFMVENEGNSMASCRLRLVDMTGRVDGSFDPPAVGVAPGESSLVLLRSRAQRGFFRRATRTLEFDIEAEQQGHATATSTLALVQPPTVPRGLILRTLALLLLAGAAVAAWAWVVQPAIEDAAADEVDRLVSEVQAEAPVTTVADGTATNGTTVDAEDDAAETGQATDANGNGQTNQSGGEDDNEEGESDEETTTTVTSRPTGVPDFARLKVEAPLTQTGDASFTVPGEQTFDLTDVRIENPFNDSGVATLLVNGEEIFLWSLDNIRGSYFEPSITQKRLNGGDNVTFSVRCDQISDPFRSTCTNAVNVGGIFYRDG